MLSKVRPGPHYALYDVLCRSQFSSLSLQHWYWRSSTLETPCWLASFQLDRLQAFMNAAARLVFQSRRYDHVTSLLHRLHWLRAPERILYKLAVLVFQCTHGLGPVYLTDTLQPVAGIPGKQRLRSSSTSALAVPPTRLATVGDRSFPVVAARIWNNLPAEVALSTSLLTFKSKLKSHLFSASFP